MKMFKLISRNAQRHLLRTILTILGMAIAIVAFCVIRSAIDAWYTQAQASSPNRLIGRNAVSLVFPLPISSLDKVGKVEGVTAVSHATWFGGIYIDEGNFFAKFAVDPVTYFPMYAEYVIPEEQKAAFMAERNAAIVGRKLADRFDWELGERIQMEGDIYPGTWDFVIRGIYSGAKEITDEATFFFHYEYLDERMRQDMPGRAGQIGTFVAQIAESEKAAQISETIDALFVNSLAETKTETEEAFALSFISMSGSIILGLRVVSFMVIGIILLVLANTMAMTARERLKEYAVLKTLGFRDSHLVMLIFGESLFIAALGGIAGIVLTMLVLPGLRDAMSDFFPYIPLSNLTIILSAVAALVVGAAAAIFPALKASNTTIVDGLRTID